MISKELIRHNFSRFAGNYDDYCEAQNRVAAKLIKYCLGRDVRTIIDIGCGTGNYTAILRRCFPSAAITAVDISPRMLQAASARLTDVSFLCEDAESVNFEDRCDLVTSNASFQWFEDFEKAAANLVNAVNPGGMLLFSVFGCGTYSELGEVLSEYYGESLSLSSRSFVDSGRVSRFLSASLNSVFVSHELFCLKYDSLWELLTSIKYTGTSGAGLADISLSREDIRAIEEIYIDKYGDITASFDVLYCGGEKK